ncbi:WD40-repeat-containing domain protein [Boletus edulis BED1]|uniref:WD40-repeat-containing domain protein n=1 Tax=Boletus edulis BED1 TaxID=1328754 RepID=A0AAD4BNP6_BOLED|nr:WD40-repeat-containing domain protein [Boletus edulis BED1]
MSLSVLEEDLPVSLDDKLSNAGAGLFFAFEKRIEALDKQLRSFTNAVRQVGSSVGILSSSFKLRERLTKISFMFRENAANLYPRKIARQAREALPNPDSKHRQRRAGIVKLVLEDHLGPDTLPAQLESFAEDIATFINCLNELPEFTDEPINQSMRSFQDDLKYWALCLAEYKTQFRSPAVQRYIHDLTPEIGDHLDGITETLSMFIETGVPTIRFQQQHSLSNLLNLSTVATIFSAVTATMLQLSCKSTGHTLADLVNTFWFSSLVFSMAAAVNSFLGLTWKQVIYRSPAPRIPWWALIWIKQTPLVFLVLSIACFSAGLMLFTYSSGQGTVTSTIITVLTAVTSLGLAAVSTRFASERWILIQHKGQKWVEEAISEMTNCLANTGIARTGRISWRWCSMRIATARGYLRRLASWIIKRKQPRELLPIVEPAQRPRPRTRAPPRPLVYHQEPAAFMPRPAAALSVCSIVTENPASGPAGPPDESTRTRHSDARQRFVNAVRSVIKLQATTRPMSPRRNSLFDRFPDPVMSLPGVRVTSPIDKLKALDISQEIATHQALVRHLQFSPNGKYLATSSWDRTSVIFRVGESFTTHRILVHVRGFIDQVAWSPNGRLLLTKLTHAVKVWSEDGVCKKTIDRQNTVKIIVWLPTGDAFLSVEGSEVVKLDLHGKVLDTYHLGQVQLISVAVTPDCCRLVGLGRSITSPSGPQPSRRSRVEKRIIVYNIHTRLIESQVPFANDIRGIAIARNAPAVLISLEKGTPQLWKLEIERDRSRAGYAQTSRLNLKHTFTLEGPVDQIVGPCHFGGKDDQFVLCAGKAGNIHIWNRETAALLHCIRPRNTPGVGNLTCIGWNHATDDPMMFATGNQDGTIRVYSTAPLDSASDDESYLERRTEGDRATIYSVHSGG